MSLFALDDRADRDRTSRRGRRSTTRSPAISAAAPAMRRSSRADAAGAAAEPTATRSMARSGRNAAAARGAAGRGDRSRSATASAGSSRRPRSTRWPSCCSRAQRHASSPAPPTSACGSPSRLRVLDPVIYIGRVRELQRDRGHGAMPLAIGAGVTYSRRHARSWRRTIRTSARCCAGSASVQMRNAGTIGGNIANGSPIGDSPPLADRARRHAACCAAARERRELPLEDFFIAYGKQDRRPGEFVESIPVPKPAPGTRFRAYKICQALRPGHLGGVAALQPRGSRTARSPTSGSPSAAWRRRPSARAKPRRRCSASPGPRRRVEAAVEALADDFTPITDMRASAGYRLPGRRATCCAAFIETTERRPRPASSATGASPMSERDPRGGVHEPRPHDSARRHVSGEAALHRRPAASRRACCTSSSASATQAHARIIKRRPRARSAPRRAWCCVLTAADIPGANDVEPDPSPRRAAARDRRGRVRRPAALRRRRRDPRPGAPGGQARRGRVRGPAGGPDVEAALAGPAVLVTEPLTLRRAAMPRRRSPRRRTGSSGRMRDRRPGPLLPRGPGRAGDPGRGRRGHGPFLDPAPDRDPAHGRRGAGRAAQRRDGRGAGAWAAPSAARRPRATCSPASAALVAKKTGRAAKMPARPRRRHGDHRQAPRLPRRLRGRLRRRRAGSRAST